MSDERDRPQESVEKRDLVGDLLRIADHGPEIPADGADRIKAAIKPQWRRQLRARARRRWTWAAAGVAAASVMAIALVTMYRSDPVATDSPDPVASFEVLHGTVEVIPAEGESTVLSELSQTASVFAGSWIRTNGESRASVRLSRGQSLRLDLETAVRLSSAESVDLEKGAVYIDSQSSNGASVEIRTPLGTTREIGTQFEVRLAGGPLSVAVREGAVAIIREDLEIEVGSGVAVTVNADGAIDRRRIAPSASTWAWVQEIAPPFDIEGRSVAAFLEWVSRETGSSVRYSSLEVKNFARETLLHGTAAGLSPTQAPEVILASCGLIGRWDNDSLVVTRAR